MTGELPDGNAKVALAKAVPRLGMMRGPVWIPPSQSHRRDHDHLV